MKKLGENESGDVIVQLTGDEAAAFHQLGAAVTGSTMFDFELSEPRRHEYIDDYAGVFGAIRAFVRSRFLVNRLARHVDDMRSVLGGDHKPSS